MFYDIPNKDGLWVYNSPSTSTTSQWQTWEKPDQYNMFFIYACGGGGGGGNTSPGGGGAGGQLMTLHAPAFLLPDTLYIQIGIGGNPAAAGGTTYVAYYPNQANLSNYFINAAGGNAGGALTGGTGNQNTITQSIFSITAQGACAGTTGSASAAGGDFSITTSCIYGGTAGGGTGFAGGNILASSIHPQLNGGANGANGNDGYVIKKPFTVLGGTGGGGGGVGGNGVMGSGGGGGGTGASGGKGGNGFVIIIGY